MVCFVTYLFQRCCKHTGERELATQGTHSGFQQQSAGAFANQDGRRYYLSLGVSQIFFCKNRTQMNLKNKTTQGTGIN